MTLYKYLCFLNFLFLFFFGCAIRPEHEAKFDVNIGNITSVMDKREDQIKDFSGDAYIRVKSPELGYQEAPVKIKYISPDKLGITIKGFAGIAAAFLNWQGDSAKVFIPSENAYFVISPDNDIPEFLKFFKFIDVAKINWIFGSIIPAKEERNNYKASLSGNIEQYSLTFEKDDTFSKVFFKGAGFLPVKEEFRQYGNTLWVKKMSDFRKAGKITYPNRIEIECGGDVIDIVFSNVKINDGIDDKKVFIKIPDNAEEINFNNAR